MESQSRKKMEIGLAQGFVQCFVLKPNPKGPRTQITGVKGPKTTNIIVFWR